MDRYTCRLPFQIQRKYQIQASGRLTPTGLAWTMDRYTCRLPFHIQRKYQIQASGRLTPTGVAGTMNRYTCRLPILPHTERKPIRYRHLSATGFLSMGLGE